MKRHSNGFTLTFAIAIIGTLSCSEVETADKPAECELGAVRACTCPDGSESYQTCIDTPDVITFADCACFEDDVAGDGSSDDLVEDVADASVDLVEEVPTDVVEDVITDTVDANNEDGEQNDATDAPGNDGLSDAVDTTDVTVDVDTSEPVDPFGTPTNFASLNVDGVIHFTWTNIEGADGYYLYSATETGITPDNYLTLDGGTRTESTTSPASLIGLETGVPIYAVLTAYRGIEQSDPTPERTITPVRELTVAPSYDPFGPDWNDYINSETPGPCGGTEPDLDGCVHAGEARRAVIPGLSDCASVTASDSLHAFDWRCDDLDGVIVYTHGLREDANLSDLINFATQSWRPITLNVDHGGAIHARSDPDDAWWGNEIVLNNTGGTLSTAGQIVVVTSADEMAPYVFGTSEIALLIAPGITLDVTDAQEAAVDTALFSFLWVEGNINAEGNTIGLYVQSSTFSMFRNLTIENADWTNGGYARCVHIHDAHNNRVHNVDVDMCSGNGIRISNSSNHQLSGIRITNVIAGGIESTGFFIIDSDRVRLSDLKIVNNLVYGMAIQRVTGSVISDVSITNSGLTGLGLPGVLGIFESTNNTFIDVLISGNAEGSVFTYGGCHNNIFLNASVMNNPGTGFQISGVADDENSPESEGRNVVMNMALFNSEEDGFRLDQSDGNTIVNLASVVTDGYHVVLDGSDNNAFLGLLKVGASYDPDGGGPDLPGLCAVWGGTTPGLNHQTCTISGDQDSSTYGPAGGESDATLSVNVDISHLLVGRVGVDDPVNSSDVAGAAVYSTDLDWFNFERSFRAWGANVGTGIADPSSQGRCNGGVGCQIWDFAYWDDDTGDNTYPVVYDVNVVPDGTVAVTHEWFTDGTRPCTDSPAGQVMTTCQTVFLLNAVELLDDSVGNDNGLCESNENCLHTPNIGAYQGHGTDMTLEVIGTGGDIENVLLYYHTNNGYTPPD